MRTKRAMACLLAAVLGTMGCLTAFASPLPTSPAATPIAGQSAIADTTAGLVGPTVQEPQAPWYDESAYRGIGWDMTLEEAAAAEQGKARSTTVTVQEDLWVYGLEMKKLVYRFEDDEMVSRTFTAKLSSAEAFSYLFFSLFRRYGVPILAEKRKAVWGDVQATITLQRSSEGLTIRYEALR